MANKIIKFNTKVIYNNNVYLKVSDVASMMYFIITVSKRLRIFSRIKRVYSMLILQSIT